MARYVIPKDYVFSHQNLLDGAYLQNMQKEKRASVLELSRMTGLSRTTIYRAFHNEATKSINVLIYMALQFPDMFIFSTTKERKKAHASKPNSAKSEKL